MADPVIGATLQVLLEKLISLTIKEINSSRDFNEDLVMLTQNVSLIQAFIYDIERPLVEKQHSLEQWLNRLERVAENAENVFDRCRYESLKTQVQNSPMKKIKKCFEKRIWLCLPEMSETKSFLEQILESLTERKVEVPRRDIIVKKLQDELGGRNYLLVLDDLWRVDSTLWYEFVDTFRGIHTSRGNCILVTTRMKRVASTIATDLHMLGKLSDHC